MDLSNRNIIRVVNSRLRKVRMIPKVDEFFDRLVNLHSDWGITGGFVRDCLFGHQSKDIDIVVDTKMEELYKSFPGLVAAEKTAFGGHRFNIDGVAFDLWTVEGSWAFEWELAEYNGLESFLDCVSLNIDAVVACPQNGIVLEKGFRDALTSGKVEFHFTEHPYPKWITKRAQKHATKYDLGLGPVAKNMIVTYLGGTE